MCMASGKVFVLALLVLGIGCGKSTIRCECDGGEVTAMEVTLAGHKSEIVGIRTICQRVCAGVVD